MRTLFNKTTTFTLLFSLLILASSCDSSDNDDAGESFDQMGEMIGASFDVFGDIAVEILLNDVSKSKPIYDCDQSGTVDYNSSSTANLYSLVFSDCNGIDGNVDLGLTTNISETAFEFGLSLDGNLTESCSMTLNNFSMGIVSNPNSTDEDQILLNGAISSTCNGESFSCAFTNDSFSDADQNVLFEDNCTAAIG
ncbi:MAG: hypothetical protein AB8G77_20675 [Rhodothermales bacterium]